MTTPLLSSCSENISAIVEQLRYYCQIDIQSQWRYLQNQNITDISLLPNLQDWLQVELNEKNHIPWKQGKEVLWLGQKLIIPENVQGYDISGLCLRVALVWWADQAEVYVNGKLVVTGDLFDSSPRVLLSNGVFPGEEFTILVKLVSPEHCDGALMRSLSIYESLDYHDPDPGFLADELEILQHQLILSAPEKLEALSTAIENKHLKEIRTSYLNFCQENHQYLSKLTNSTIYLLGHAHLDLAWLWPVSETWKAAENTFNSVLNLQKDFPELIFCHSTPALYAWMEKNRPELFTAIQHQVKSGKWEIIGGSYVEPDLNLISGESIVRQLLYGQRYYLAKFGKISPIIWLPDTFGFCATLPQFLSQAGIEYFVTQKLRWNDTTKFQHSLFWWRSPDGSQVLSFMSALIGEAIAPVKMAQYLQEWQNQTSIENALWLPGIGDHGGGPTRDMLEVARKWQSSPIFPQLEFTTAEKYLQDVKSACGDLPIWEDELYLEFHRGCYTTHADQKKYNRQCEHLLYQAELFATLAKTVCGVNYPQAEIETAWKKVLFNQFHDILPGSSITQVYEDALPEWEDVQNIGKQILENSLRAIASYIKLPQSPHPHSIPILIFNSLNWERREIVNIALPSLPEDYTTWQIYDLAGNKLPSQLIENSENRNLLFVADIPSVGYNLYFLIPHEATNESETCQTVFPNNYILENEYLQIEVNPTTGNLNSIFDKTQQREILAGSGNELQFFQDSGQYWDAWNIDPDYHNKPLPPAKLTSCQWLHHGIIEQRLRVVRNFGSSEFIQDYILQTSSPILKIENIVHWYENQILVKTAFPLNITSEISTSEIPCGVIHRSTNPKTPAETAKWEIPALRWVDLTQDDVSYGVSLLNDCKYGYDTTPHQLRLTLLRSSNWPDSRADRGIHQFTYALYPHSGSWQNANTVKYGYELNTPIQVLFCDDKNIANTANNLTPKMSFLGFTADNLILMALKPREDNLEKYILRFYECAGETAVLCLRSEFFRLGEVVDLLENVIEGGKNIQDVQAGKIMSFELLSSL
ncbi:alpha-mannosidase [Anabaena sp. FACHB-1237]|uniref:alpha-mannosidase n=1 Tax=Anabaena sp. FACHB-1237 TaxID=2692769 RepID=UPI001680E280|nr:alpha-mannosidase [Anabaena sp. FACHB-1237]MBD2138549.1 alpha-mannosidase [Anabaena sp. FACHB-1237]